MSCYKKKYRFLTFAGWKSILFHSLHTFQFGGIKRWDLRKTRFVFRHVFEGWSRDFCIAVQCKIVSSLGLHERIGDRPQIGYHYHIRHGVTQSKHFRRGIYLSTIFNGKEVLYSAFFGHLWHSTDARSS